MKSFVCPMHREIVSDKPGRCPKCGMALERIKNHESGIMDEKKSSVKQASSSYGPLFIVLSLIFVGALAVSYPWFNLFDVIQYFMAGFFIVFAGFKLVDLKGFAEGYFTYDILAKRWFTYGYIYPFIELFFGLAMIIGLFETQILLLEIIIMTFSGIGVLIKLLRHEKFQCVCLGTFLKVPLTKVTLIEDFGMAALALFLLLK